MPSGYTNCACRDCFEIAISPKGKPALCSECQEAGCMCFDEYADIGSPRNTECQREGAYLSEAELQDQHEEACLARVAPLGGE